MWASLHLYRPTKSVSSLAHLPCYQSQRAFVVCLSIYMIICEIHTCGRCSDRQYSCPSHTCFEEQTSQTIVELQQIFWWSFILIYKGEVYHCALGGQKKQNIYIRQNEHFSLICQHWEYWQNLPPILWQTSQVIKTFLYMHVWWCNISYSCISWKEFFYGIRYTRRYTSSNDHKVLTTWCMKIQK